MSFRNDDASGDAERPSGIPTVNPWAARPPEPSAPPQPPLPEPPRSKWFNWPSVAFAVVIFGGIGAQAYQELSKPEAWAYWKDLYVSPSMASSEVGSLDPDNSGRGRPALAITGEIGPATASWFREKLDEAKLAAGDTVLLSSPGGNVGQAIIMGEIIRARGLTTAVGTVDSAGRIKPSYCASACVMTYAGGKARIGAAHHGLCAELHDQDGRRLVGRRGDVSHRENPLARHQRGRRHEPRHRSGQEVVTPLACAWPNKIYHLERCIIGRGGKPRLYRIL